MTPVRPVLVMCLAIAACGFSEARAQSSEHHTHWEPYRERNREPSINQNLQDPALQGAVDLHVHIDPDAYPRQWDAFEVAEIAKGRGMRALLLKNHWTETAGYAEIARTYATQGIEIFGGLALNTTVGGMNPQAVRYFADVAGDWARVVWMPTHDSEHEVKFNEDRREFVPVSEDGELLTETLEVLDVIAENELTLATGHVTPEEALMIIRAAKERGIERIIATHPMLGAQFTDMSDEQMTQTAELGGYIEVVSGNLRPTNEDRQHVFDMIRMVGPEHVIVSSDSGLVGTPNHPDALAMAAVALREEGFTEDEIDLMFKQNPAWLVGLDSE